MTTHRKHFSIGHNARVFWVMCIEGASGIIRHDTTENDWIVHCLPKHLTMGGMHMA